MLCAAILQRHGIGGFRASRRIQPRAGAGSQASQISLFNQIFSAAMATAFLMGMCSSQPLLPVKLDTSQSGLGVATGLYRIQSRISPIRLAG